MGHAYRKSGSTGTSGEQAYATSVANACVNLLHGRGGWTVRRILADDSLSRYAGDAFVAIHCDGSTSASARGASIGYRNAAGQRFGQAWKRFYLLRGWTGGFRPDNYTPALAGYYGTGNALSQGNSRAFIAECGFMTNAQDRALLTAAGGPTRVALAIGDALGITEGNDDMATPAETWGYKGVGEDEDAYKFLRDTRAIATSARSEATNAKVAANQANTKLDALAGKVGTLGEQIEFAVAEAVANYLSANPPQVAVNYDEIASRVVAEFKKEGN
jgi:hypothetical protein